MMATDSIAKEQLFDYIAVLKSLARACAAA